MVYSALSDDTSTVTQFIRRKAIIITTDGTNIPTDYQVKLTITYELEMQANFNDIRFNTRAGGYIDYWIESRTASTTATVWIKLSDAITDPDSDMILMFYGNDELDDGGDIEDTMIFGDDFEDESLDLTTRWSWVGTDTKTEASGYLQVTTGVEPDSMLYSQNTFARPYILEFNVELDSERSLFGVRENSGIIDTDYTRWKHSFHHTSDTGSGKRLFTLENNSFTDSTKFWTIDTKYKYRIEVHSTGADYYQNDILARDGTAGTTDPTKIGFVGYSSSVFKLHDVFIRKYIANEPTLSYSTAQHQRRVSQFIG